MGPGTSCPAVDATALVIYFELMDYFFSVVGGGGSGRFSCRFVVVLLSVAVDGVWWCESAN